ncbi:hypothetical protein [Hyphomicrobium sp. CS1GBMeth3]|uniref:hypothetical protein n=1 Tax=Hyphomicrobium sp. CS1GBMeth3 TaxID=1892845 RepID=UPI0009314CA2|nr:hypothetical protein [Hyphomicrobium sp. CS1GBMeth3]
MTTKEKLIDALTDYWNDEEANPPIAAWFLLLELGAFGGDHRQKSESLTLPVPSLVRCEASVAGV